MRDFLARIPFVLAVALTTAWVVLVAAYLHHMGWAGLFALTPEELAVVLAAIGGPPAALWLFLAVFEQRRAFNHLIGRLGEVAAQNRQSLHQAETQTRAMMQMQAALARAQGGDVHRLAFHDLAANAAILAERLGVTPREAAAAAWTRYGAGDITVFVQAFLNFAGAHPDIAERMADAVERDAVARAALAGFVRRYQRFLASLADDKLALEILEEGALGRAYRLFKTADDLANVAQPESAPEPQLEPLPLKKEPQHPGTDLFEEMERT